ncbi:MAG: HAMP domain-containing protein [Spirochaetaceae bacterium]|jgi:adenylate cyclase|nr:HAMP domain-containing protein [Spirochaetaceae bacterium]
MGLLTRAEFLLRHKKKRAGRARSANRIRYSIARKLIGIVTILLLVSISAIIIMISMLLSGDVRLAAEDNNFSINRRNTRSVSSILDAIHTTVRLILFDGGTAFDTVSFFNDNPLIAAAAVNGIDGENKVYLNGLFGYTHNLTEERITQYLRGEMAGVLEESKQGRFTAFNATPALETPLMALFFPVNEYTAAAVFVPVDEILKTFGREANAVTEGGSTTYLLNEAGDVLVHPDMSLITGASNFSRIQYISALLEMSDDTVQRLYIDESGRSCIVAHQKINIIDSLSQGSFLVVTIVSEESVLRGIEQTVRRNFILGIGVFFISAALIIVFSRTLTVPIKKLTGAARKIESGDYDFELHVNSKDEIGVLTESFNSMRYSLENFERFTNKTLVKLAREGRLARTGINKNATVAFIFIRDFGEMTGGLRAHIVVEFVNEFLRRVVPCVTGTGGVVDKFLTQGGVVIMALWGAAAEKDAAEENSPEANALACVRACLMMRLSLSDFNEERDEQYWGYAPLIKMGCGINSGNLIAGQIGSEDRMEYTVIGDTVNLAARLEGPNEVFDTDILISEDTRNLLGEKVLCAEMPHIEVKGKEKALRVFSVVNMAQEADSLALLEDYRCIIGEREPKKKSSGGFPAAS